MAEKNKPLEKLDPQFIKKNIKAITFDVDGVIVPTGTFLRQSDDWSKLTIETHTLDNEMVEILNELKKDFQLIFSSGRSILHLETMLNEILWNNVCFIGENGNFVFADGKMSQLSTYDEEYFQKLVNIKKDLRKFKKENPKKVHGFEPKHVIITLHTSQKMPKVKEIVKENDPEDSLYCLWTSEGYDIGHKKTNKKTAFKFICEQLSISPDQIITSGNHLNDREMLNFGTGVSVNPDQVEGEYAIPKKKGRLGGKVLAKYILEAVS